MTTAPEFADLIVRNAAVTTLDPARPAASAVAVRGQRIVAVGDDADVEARRGPRTRLIDALGRRATTVMTLTMTGIAADSSLAGGSNIHFTRRGASVAVMLLGAIVGAALSRAGLGWPIVAAIAAAGVAAALIWRADEERSSRST
jgi:hypothetical protein